MGLGSGPREGDPFQPGGFATPSGAGQHGSTRQETGSNQQCYFFQPASAGQQMGMEQPQAAYFQQPQGWQQAGRYQCGTCGVSFPTSPMPMSGQEQYCPQVAHNGWCQQQQAGAANWPPIFSPSGGSGAQAYSPFVPPAACSNSPAAILQSAAAGAAALRPAHAIAASKFVRAADG